MQLVRFAISNLNRPRLGVLTPLGILDAQSCCQLYCLAQGRETIEIPSTRRLLENGSEWMTLLRAAWQWALNQNVGGTVLFHREKVQLLAPIAHPRKIIGIGMNYRDHCAELGQPEPKEPVIFAKFTSSILAPEAPIVRPPCTQELDYEAELGVVIGSIQICTRTRFPKFFFIKDFLARYS